MPMLIVFLVGWFGANWWPGQWYDAPRPGNPEPWWMRLVVGVLAGVAAVAIVRVANVTVDSLLGVTTVLATGNVVGAIVGAIAGMARK